jgi:hypothetical protein
MVVSNPSVALKVMVSSRITIKSYKTKIRKNEHEKSQSSKFVKNSRSLFSTKVLKPRAFQVVESGRALTLFFSCGEGPLETHEMVQRNVGRLKTYLLAKPAVFRPQLRLGFPLGSR